MPRPNHHADNALHPWAFIQTRVWVDASGKEHVIADMPDGYVANVINFCRENVLRIRRLVEAYTMDELWQGLKTGQYDHERTFDHRRRDRVESLNWLEATPLLHALRARLGNPSDAELAKITAEAQAAYEAKKNKTAGKPRKRPAA